MHEGRALPLNGATEQPSPAQLAVLSASRRSDLVEVDVLAKLFEKLLRTGREGGCILNAGWEVNPWNDSQPSQRSCC